MDNEILIQHIIDSFDSINTTKILLSQNKIIKVSHEDLNSKAHIISIFNKNHNALISVVTSKESNIMRIVIFKVNFKIYQADNKVFHPFHSFITTGNLPQIANYYEIKGCDEFNQFFIECSKLILLEDQKSN